MRTTHLFAVMAALVFGAFVPMTRATDNACIVPDLGMPLAGANAVDCGVARSGKRWQRAGVAACARKAIARGTPVRFGVGVMGIDAFTCDVVIMDADKSFWRVTYEWDAALDQPTAFVGRCATIDPDWKDPAGMDHFGPRECVADAAAFERAAIRRP